MNFIKKTEIIDKVQLNFKSIPMYTNEDYELMHLFEIRIPKEFKFVNDKKKYKKLIRFLVVGTFADDIVIDKNNMLVDGFSTYTILFDLGIDEWIVSRIDTNEKVN